jgi:hypothetical protein
MIKATYDNGLKIKFYPIDYKELDNYFKNLKLFKEMKGGIKE